MCCFSEEVEIVSNTQIFARLDGENQYLVYQMKFSSAEDLAMILPIPIKPGAEEDAVTFISMEDYPDFLYGWRNCFPPWTWKMTAFPILMERLSLRPPYSRFIK